LQGGGVAEVGCSPPAPHIGKDQRGIGEERAQVGPDQPRRGGDEEFRPRRHLQPTNPPRKPVSSTRYRRSIGTYDWRPGPVYSARGRMSRLLACCSRTCAAQPTTRLMAKIGVNWSVGIPIVLYAGPEYRATLG